MAQQPGITSLAIDTLNEIAKYLDPSSVIYLGNTCKHFYQYLCLDETQTLLRPFAWNHRKILDSTTKNELLEAMILESIRRFSDTQIKKLLVYYWKHEIPSLPWVQVVYNLMKYQRKEVVFWSEEKFPVTQEYCQSHNIGKTLGYLYWDELHNVDRISYNMDIEVSNRYLGLYLKASYERGVLTESTLHVLAHIECHLRGCFGAQHTLREYFDFVIVKALEIGDHKALRVFSEYVRYDAEGLESLLKKCIELDFSFEEGEILAEIAFKNLRHYRGLKPSTFLVEFFRSVIKNAFVIGRIELILAVIEKFKSSGGLCEHDAFYIFTNTIMERTDGEPEYIPYFEQIIEVYHAKKENEDESKRINRIRECLLGSIITAVFHKYTEFAHFLLDTKFGIFTIEEFKLGFKRHGYYDQEEAVELYERILEQRESSIDHPTKIQRLV